MADIAVIIPTYNRASSLKRAIDSVQSQRLSDIEVIVIDDGSDDDTAEIARRYPICRYVKIAHSGLPAVARNVGVRITNATYLAFLDSDDEWVPQKIERQLASIVATSCGLVCSNASLIDDGKAVRPYLAPGKKHSGRVLKELLSDNFVITSSVVVRRELFEKTGGFSEDPMLRGLEDYDLWLRIAAVADFYYIDKELVLYRQSGASLSRTRSMLSHWQGMERIFSQVADRGELGPVLNRQVANCKSSMCDEYLGLRQYRNFADTFAALCRISPIAAVKYPATLMRTVLKKLLATD